MQFPASIAAQKLQIIQGYRDIIFDAINEYADNPPSWFEPADLRSIGREIFDLLKD